MRHKLSDFRLKGKIVSRKFRLDNLVNVMNRKFRANLALKELSWKKEVREKMLHNEPEQRYASAVILFFETHSTL